MPIVVGAPRSGTTLLRLMLDAHPQLAIPPETGFLALGADLAGSGDELRERFLRAIVAYPPEAPNWSDFGLAAEEFERRLRQLRPFTAAEGFRLFYRMYAERFGKPRWGDKTPTYGCHLGPLQTLLPEARFLHVIRDGRDVAVSLRDCWFSPGRDIRVQACYWRSLVQATRQQARLCRHYLEVRYEDLVRGPEPVLRSACAFLELPFDAAMLSYHERAAERLCEHRDRIRADGTVQVSHAERLRQQAATLRPPDPSRIGRWQCQLTRVEVLAYEAEAGPLLRELGYALSPADAGC
jgi:hypothetical protein